MTTIDETLAERGARYGDFSDRAICAQRLQDIMRGENGWVRLSSDKRQALTVIADKIARILTGDPEYTDNWHDIQGYAKLAEDRCAEPASSDSEDYWISRAPGDPAPKTGTFSHIRLRRGAEYRADERGSWYWGDCGPGTITHIRVPAR